MSDTATMPLQSDPQPITAHKIIRSRKAPSLKTAVILKRSQGQDKTSISRDLGIARNTVTAILEESDAERHLEVGRQQCATLIPDSIRVVKHRLSQNSETAAFRLLEGIGVLGKDVKPSPQPVKVELSQAIGIMFQQSPKNEAIEVKSVETGAVGSAGSRPEVQGK